MSYLRYIRGQGESSSLAYNRRETWVKRPLGRDPDRSWCHLHTSVKLLQLTAERVDNMEKIMGRNGKNLQKMERKAKDRDEFG